MIKYICSSLLLILNIFSNSQIFSQGVTAGFDVSVQQGCSPLSVTFTNTSQNATNFKWDFGNGTAISEVENPTTTYINTGFYNVKLIAINGNDTDTIEKLNFIEVFSSPVAGFSFTTTNLCEDDNFFEFTNTSSGSDSQFWDFGDGNSSNDENPTHQFIQPGNFEIKLNAFNANCDSLISYPITIYPTPSITAEIDTNFSCDSNFSFTFSANSSETISDWTWDFGLGSLLSSTNSPINFSYNQSGSFSPKVIATSNENCVDSLFLETVFIPSVSDYSIQSSTSSGCPPLIVDFNISPASTVQTSIWDFGDNNNFTGSSSSSNSYLSSGTYSVSSNITDLNGCSQNINLPNSIIVDNSPEGIYSTNNTSGCPPLLVDFNVTTDPLNTIAWDFGDTNFSSNSSIQNTYQYSGTYYPKLSITSPTGCIKEYIVDTIQVGLTLTNFIADPTTGCAALEVDFTNSAPPEATSFEWDFGDGNTSTEANPTHIYDTIGEYTVIFRCSDSLTGCTSEYTINEMITTFGEEDVELPNQDTIYACSPYTFSADAGNIGDSYWNWDFGDGNYGSGPNIMHQYTQSGIYTVLLNADAPNACMYNITNYATIVIDENTEINLDISINSSCDNGTINIINNSNGVTDHLWDMGDGGIVNTADINHTYNTSSSYLISYQALTPAECLIVKTIPVIFNCDENNDPILTDPPPIVIEIDTTEADTLITGPLVDPTTNEVITKNCGPELINLSTPYPSADSHFWDFGDGYTSTDSDPVHFYSSEGTFNLTHYATYSNGDVDTIVINQFIDQYVLDASFTINKINLCNEANFEFENSSLNSSSWEWKLDNELISSDSIHNITLPLNDSVKTLSLRVEDEFGCFSESQQALFLYQPLALIEQDTFACNSSVVNFECSVIGEPGHSWNLDDGTIIGPDADTSITHSYTQNGFYEVILELNDQGCVREIKLDSLEIYQPNATFSPSNSSSICNTDSIFFIANESSYSTYNWTGGNIIGSGPSTWIQFNDEGKQVVSLSISDRGCTGITSTDTIIVNKANAYFNYNQLNGCIPIDVEFEDSSVNPVNWVWSFGDGNFGSDEEFTHTYTSMPTDSVTLTITDINGCKDSLKSTIINELNADFFADDTIVCANTPIVFSGVDEVVNEWIWDFGDGNNSNDSVPTHSYQEQGIYQVELIVSDGNGCNDTVIKSSYIQVEKVVSSFDFSDPGTCPPITTTFTNSSSGADNYVWDFGDGADNIINNNPIVYHTYDSSGSFSLSLVASNISGCTDTTTYSDSLVIPGPQLNFSIDQNIGCDSLTIIISDSSTSTLSYSWDFGDGNSEDIDPTTNIVTHTYTTIGSFNVVLVGSDNIVADNGCISSYKSLDTIRIYPSPEISNSIQDSNLCLGTTFTALNSTLADSHSWIYNNQTYIGTSPEILIDYEGSEQLSYTATNTNGNCSTSQYYNLTSHQIPDVSIIDLGIICSNQGVVDFNSLNENILNDITWSGDAIVDADNGLFDPSLISDSTLITASFDSICNSQDSITVIVENPPDATIITQDTSYCFGVTIQTPSVLNSGGQWYGDNVNPNTGEINGELSEGNHEYLYILENSNCSDSNSYEIEILHQNNATINADSIICDNLEIFTLSSVDTGGVWSGQFIDGSGVIDVTLTNPGSYNYYYEINGICPDLDSITIEVIEFIPAQINPPLDYCEGTDTVQLTATTTTGTWSGLEDTHYENGLFLTGSLSDSSYNVYYSLNNACPDVDTIDITILPQPDISIDIVQELPCVSYPVSVINNSPNLSTENYSWFVNDSLFYQNFSEPYFIFDTGFYQIKTIAINQYNCKSELIYEDIINIYDTTAHPNPTIIRSTVFENSSVYTEWKDTSLYLNPLGKNQVYRSINNEVFNFIIELDTNIHYFLDEDVDVFNNNYTYYIISKNVCEINSASSNIGNSILLNFQKPEEFKTKLLWNSYNQWDNGINRYEIQKLNEQSEWKVIQTLEDLNNSIIIDE